MRCFNGFEFVRSPLNRGRSMAWIVVAGLLTWSTPTTHAQNGDEDPGPEDFEAGARLQVFLDRAGFGPGIIDGRPGEFTVKALALYEQAHGMDVSTQVDADTVDADVMPDVSHLDFSGVDPVFVDYTVTEADFEHVGDLPREVPKQAQLNAMPYRSVAEAVAERFHTSTDFLEVLNEDKMADIEVGTSLRVPNVEPFDLAKVIEQAEQDIKDQERAEKEAEEAEGNEEESGVADEARPQDDAQAPAIRVVVDGDSNMLSLFVDDKLTAAFPVTIGVGRNETPTGDWKVTSLARMPYFRHDESMLQRGVRSDDYHHLPPGPNNPVGVMWIQLNRSGIGLHGTNSPETIGRASSAGCVRLANWDVVRLAEWLDADVPVEIR